MSACAIENRRIFVNTSDMEEQNEQHPLEKTPSDVDDATLAKHDGEAKGVKEASMAVAAEAAVEAAPEEEKATSEAAESSMSHSRSSMSHPAGENADSRTRHIGKSVSAMLQGARNSRKRSRSGSHSRVKMVKSNLFQWPKSLARRCGKFESGSGSGDQDAAHQEDSLDVAAKKRKTRRGKPKHKKLKPYSKQQQLSYQQRPRCKSIGRLAKTGRQIRAPYNTTQFLMEDHSDLPDLDQKLSIATSADVLSTFQKPTAPSRTRDSSFSIDSDEDYFYSSPEDEEEFLTKEFSSAYEDLHAERLNALSKSELIQEYLQLEAKVDLLTKRLRGKNICSNEEKESENKNGVSTDFETAKKLKICQQHIEDLMKQNEQLKRENEALRAQRHGSSVSSVDSESDSDSTSNGNRSTCSCPLREGESSPDRTSCKSRKENSDKDGSSEFSIDTKSDSSDVSQSNSPKSAFPTILTNGRAVINETDGLPT